MWVTTSTFGEVEFVAGQYAGEVPRARPTIALNVRNAVEVPAS